MPAWSPDGEKISFSRRYPSVSMGRQIWLMDEDGSNPQPMTEESNLDHTALQFSADGSTLLFQTTQMDHPMDCRQFG